MSWPEAQALKRFVAAAILAVAAASTAGCGSGGFQPLYGPSSAGVSTRDAMASVDIAPIPGRVGQRIRNELLFDQSATSSFGPPTTRLDIVVTESVASTLVGRTGDSASQTYQLEARYRLLELGSNKVVLEGRSVGSAAFDRFAESVYANVRARDDAESRAARTIADDIRLRLAGHFASRTN